MKTVEPAAFLLIKTDGSAFDLAAGLEMESAVHWARPVYGPFQVVAYVHRADDAALARYVEAVRALDGVKELDARLCKPIPGDEDLRFIPPDKNERALLLINVNKEEKERVVTWNLRKLPAVTLARAMWGPTDILAIVHADDREQMRDVICDEVKVARGVAANTTLYCYPDASLAERA